MLLKLGGPGMLEALQVVQRVRADVDKERCGETGVRLTLPTASLRTTLDPSGEFGKQLKKPKPASQGAQRQRRRSVRAAHRARQPRCLHSHTARVRAPP